MSVDTTILERQIDGVFCTDGMLHYSPVLRRVVYVYYYRNQYILADTNLARVNRFRTIDTTSRARIKVSIIDSDGSTTLGVPPVVVNRRSCVFGVWLFIQSGLVGDNEDPNDLSRYALMDVYNLATHQYKFSFYLPFAGRNQLTSFAVFENRIAAVYGQHLFAYEMRPDAFWD
ncbi:hypothetical protein [Chryseolinea soli]|nr:hypothetical protein [Chryseolinea soli]